MTLCLSPTDSNTKVSNVSRERNDSGKKSGNASTSGEQSKRNSMDSLAQEHDSKEASGQDKSQPEGKDGKEQLFGNRINIGR